MWSASCSINWTPTEKLVPCSSAAPLRSVRERMSCSLSYQPVVPTTILAPLARQARMFWTTASGVVKSMTASKPMTKGGVSAAALWFSFASRTCTLWPRSAATSATSLPVLPTPRTRMRIRIVLLSVGGDGSCFNVEDCRIGRCEELLMQRTYRLFDVLFVDHEAHINFARTLRDHTDIDVRNRRKDLRCDAALAANILAHQADQGLVALVLYISDAAQLLADCRQRLTGIDCNGDRDF